LFARNQHLSLTIILNSGHNLIVSKAKRTGAPRVRRGQLAALTLPFFLAGCSLFVQPGANDGTAGSDGAPNDKPQIVTSIYPLNFVATEVAGGHAQVSSLVPPGADAHHGEISLRQLRHLQHSDLLVYLSDFQPAVDQAVRSTQPAHILDVADHITLQPYSEDDDHEGGGHDDHGHDDHDHDDHDHGAMDPHFWLDPTNLATVTQALGEQLAVLNPENADDYRKRADNLANDLNELSADFAAGLENCSGDTIVVSHAAFGYLTGPFDITQIGIAGLDPDSEPSLARIREIRDLVADYDISTVFYESPTNPYVAQKVADSLGLRTAFLDPLEIQYHPDQDYLAVMQNNLTTLRSALECQ